MAALSPSTGNFANAPGRGGQITSAGAATGLAPSETLRSLASFGATAPSGEVAIMKALTWQGKRDVRGETGPDPKIRDPTDVIIKVTSTGLCGSDLHLYEVLGPFLDAVTFSGTNRWAS